jgi:release factor glutamine methyltransferase
VLEAALRLAKRTEAESAVDVGTGCGILGIALALEAKLEVTATDISEEALGVAKKNAEAHGAELAWACGSLLEPLGDPIGLVVSNLPYIDPADRQGLQRELKCEPPEALFAEGGGTGLIKMLLLQAHARQAKCLALEIGSGQGAELAAYASNIGWQNIEIKQDMSKHDRVLTAVR